MQLTALPSFAVLENSIPMEINTHEENSGAVGLLYCVLCEHSLLVSSEHHFTLHLGDRPAVKHTNIVLHYLSDMLFLSISALSSSWDVASCAILVFSFLFLLLLISLPLISPSLSWLGSQLADTSSPGLTIHAGPAEFLLAWLRSHPAQLDFSLKQKRRWGRGFTQLPLSWQCASPCLSLPSNLPTLPSTAQLGTLPNTPSLTPLSRAYQTQAENLNFFARYFSQHVCLLCGPRLHCSLPMSHHHLVAARQPQALCTTAPTTPWCSNLASLGLCCRKREEAVYIPTPLVNQVVLAATSSTFQVERCSDPL